MTKNEEKDLIQGTKPNQTETKAWHLSMMEDNTGANNLTQNLSEPGVEQKPGEDGTARAERDYTENVRRGGWGIAI